MRGRDVVGVGMCGGHDDGSDEVDEAVGELVLRKMEMCEVVSNIWYGRW
jgi:hypothetical protein